MMLFDVDLFLLVLTWNHTATTTTVSHSGYPPWTLKSECFPFIFFMFIKVTKVTTEHKKLPKKLAKTA